MRHFVLYAFLIATVLTSVMMSPPPLRVIFFGDSITEAGVGPAGYITQLRGMLPAGNFERTGAGIGGNKVYDLYLRLERDVLDRHPDVVVVFVGVNDVWHKRTMGTGTDADKFVAFYDALITKMQEKGIRVVLATPALIGEKTDCSNELDGDLNHYAQLIRESGGKIIHDACPGSAAILGSRRVVTNSFKQAHHALTVLGSCTAVASTDACIEVARTGRWR